MIGAIGTVDDDLAYAIEAASLTTESDGTVGADFEVCAAADGDSPRGLLAGDADEVNNEDEVGIGADDGSSGLSAVCLGGRNLQESAAADSHANEAFVPAGDDGALAEGEVEGLASSAVGAVELTAVGSEHADVTDRQDRTNFCGGAIAFDEIGGLKLAERTEPVAVHLRCAAIADIDGDLRTSVAVGTIGVIDDHVDVAAIFGSNDELRLDGHVVALVGLDAAVERFVEQTKRFFFRGLGRLGGDCVVAARIGVVVELVDVGGGVAVPVAGRVVENFDQ